MAAFESGVKSYIHATAAVAVHFPVDWNGREHIACIHCPYLSGNDRICQLNKEPVFYPEKYVGPACPLTGMEAQ
ncbi:MAG: hypothetical protein UD963_11360 [Christensenellales bacterium]|nr:hypothetical protein [Christensenellales bacterium]DAK59387.1 MAG TPA: hypothetical protein [Caudoviricetes sp.]